MHTRPKAVGYDVVIAGAGHNGLVAAAYLAQAGLSVLVLERAATVGGASISRRVSSGMDAELSVYAYLVSLLPSKIISDLNLDLELRSRTIASWTPYVDRGRHQGLLATSAQTRAAEESFRQLTGSGREYTGYLRFRAITKALCKRIWPTLLQPLPTRAELQRRLRSKDEKTGWEMLIERPLGYAIERYLEHDVTRGIVYTDAAIGALTHPHDPSLLQNKTFLQHVVGNGSGEWRVPVGGMGRLVDQLVRSAVGHGAKICTGTRVARVEPEPTKVNVGFQTEDQWSTVEAKFLLVNSAPPVLASMLPGYKSPSADEGSVFKVNLLLKRLPRPKANVEPNTAFCGTAHVDEGYENLKASYRSASQGLLPQSPPGELYCHTLTDPSVLSPELARAGYHALTYFGLEMPHSLFSSGNESVKQQALSRCLGGVNRYLADSIEVCLATDSDGKPCIEAKSPVDIEQELAMPAGNIFHGNLSWPFAETDEERWGVETGFDRVYLCGSGAKRGGGVSGIPGHNAAMKVLESLGRPLP